MNILGRALAWRTKKARRAAINRLNAHGELRLVEWMPRADSPLHVDGASVRLPMDGIIGPRTLAHGHWHDEHTALIRQECARLRPGPGHYLIDVGANIGLVTRQVMAAAPGQWAGAMCFEPEAGNIELLRWNLRGLPGVTIEPVALSDRAGTAVLHVDTGNAGDCSLLELPSGVQRKGVQQQQVPLMPCDEAARRIEQAAPAGSRFVWKSDTQGHDLTIVAAMPDSLWARTDVAMIEVRSVDVADAVIDRFLAVAGGFAHRHAIKRGRRPIGLPELASFCKARSGSEFDLLLTR